jgi:toxin ParE1/3/4
MNVELSPRARLELAEILEYYAAQQPGLDAQFLAEFEYAARRLGQFPEIGSVAGGLVPSVRRSRRLVMRRFPYLLIYSLTPARVTIVAIAHQSRWPGSWQNRMEESGAVYLAA